MLKTSLRFLPLASVLLLPSFGAGCATTLPAPPIQTGPHDAPGTVGAGVTEIEAAGSFGGAIFEGSFHGGQATVRHGIDDRSDVVVRGVAGRIGNTGEEPGSVPVRRSLYALRLGFARDIVPDILMTFGGIGGGATAAGGYMGLDYGFSLGYGNRYFVPYLAGSVNLSTPLTRPTIDFTQSDDTMPVLRRAYTSFGISYALGFRIPYGGHRSGGEHDGAITFAYESSNTMGDDPADMYGTELQIAYFGFYVGVAHRFGGSGK
jgi:hypothetical protein